jgi:hypothetical protein
LQPPAAPTAAAKRQRLAAPGAFSTTATGDEHAADHNAGATSARGAAGKREQGGSEKSTG